MMYASTSTGVNYATADTADKAVRLLGQIDTSLNIIIYLITIGAAMAYTLLLVYITYKVIDWLTDV